MIECTFVPQSRLNGAALRAVTGIEQVVVIDADISQLTVSTENVIASLYLIFTMKPVIGEPPLSGATQLIMTLSGYQVVVGAAGCAGTYAVKMLTKFEKMLKP